MQTSLPPHQAAESPTRLHDQRVNTWTQRLPPPLDDPPLGLRAGNHTAIAKVAALLPADTDALDLAAQCIAAGARTEEVLRLRRQHTDDIALAMRLNAQYASMVRTALAVHGREAIESAASADAPSGRSRRNGPGHRNRSKDAGICLQ